MPNLKEKMIADLKTAMKAKEELKTSTLRMLKASIMNFEVSGANKVATNEVVVDLIQKGVKQRREAAEGFEKGGNQAMAQKELAEIKILETYLPEQMSEEALRVVVKEVVGVMNATASAGHFVGPADFGKVMGAVMAKVKGKADGQLVSKVVKEVLG